MSSDIQLLTNRLLAALNSNYEVIDTSEVLLVISQLEQTTITKKQLEATRLGKYINLLRSRTWSESLARRAKNLIKKWRNLVITPATVGVGGSGGGSQQSQSQQHHPHQSNQSESQSVMKHHHVSLSQPTSPVIQLNDNQKSSRHYPGQPRNIENSSLPEYPCSGSGSSSIIKNVPSTSRKQQLQHQQHASSLSNGGQQPAGVHKSHSGKSTSLFSKSSNKSPQLSQTTKKQPISFANLIESQLHPPGGVVGGGGGSQGVLGPGAGPSSFLVDDNRSQSPLTLPRIPRIPRDRQSPMIIEHSVSPLDLDQNSNPSREGSLALPSIATGPASLTVMNNNTISSCSRLLNGDYAATSIDLHDSNSDSEMIGTLRDSMIEVQRFLENRSSEHRKSKKHKKDKRRHKQERLHDSSVPSDEVITKSTGRNDQIPLLSDETQICGCNTFPIQETLSLSNSSLSRFPSTSTNITITASNRGLGNNTVTKIKSDLTFAGKFKKTSPNNAGSLLLGGNTVATTQVPPTSVDGLGCDAGNIVPLDGPTHPLVGNGKEATAAATSYPTVINPAKKSKRNDGRSSVVVIESRSCSPFTPIRGNSNDSTSSSSHNSAQDLIEVVNHESQGLDDMRMRPITSILPQQLLQQQPPQPLLKPAMATVEMQESSVPKENKIPKRRGRKKGSKGADAMLAQFNNQLFEGSKLLSLASLSSSKKVKTTKELLADIQNRKFESTVSSPTLAFQSRPPSTSSEPSLHSASTSDACSTNATISTVARSTPDKNIVLAAPFRPSGVDEDSGSNMSGSGIVLKKEHPGSDGDVKLNHHSTKVEATTSIEEDIQRLMSSLPLVKREDIDWGAGDDLICTCTVKETEPQLQPDGVVLEKDDDDNRDDDYDENFKFQVIIKPPPTEIRPLSRQEDGGISVKIGRSPSPGKVKVQQKPVKSIFDLDYDEENDPLRSFVEAAKTVKIEASEGDVDGSKFPTPEQESHEKVISVSLPAQTSKPEVMPFIAEVKPLNSLGGAFEAGLQTQGLPQNIPQFELIEDPDCPARQRYEIQTNCITKFHVHSLHNRYVPGVNGNWDQSDCCKGEVDGADSGAMLTPDGFYERVVPQYDFLVMDKIPKDLSHMRFGRNYKRQLKMKRKRSPSSANGSEEGAQFKHQRRECPSGNLGKIDDIIAIAVKREIDDGFDSNMNLSNCSDKAAATGGSPAKLGDGGNEPIVRGLVRGSGGDTTEQTTPLSNHSSNHNSNGGSRRSSSCSNSSISLSNPLSCSNNGSKPNVSVSHNLSNNIDDTGDNSVDNCSEYREDGEEDDEGAFYDDEDEDDDEDDEDHGKFQVQVVEPESTWSTSTVGNKLVLTLKKTPLSLSFKCTDKAGTSRKRDSGGGDGGRAGNVRVKVEDEEGGREVSDRNGNEMAVAPDTVDSLSNNVASSGWTERAPYECELNEPSATTTTTTTTMTTTTIITTTTSTKKQQSAIELRDHPPKGVVINQKDFEAPQAILEVNQDLMCSGSIDRCNDSKDGHEDNDFEDVSTLCSSPGLNRKCEEDDDADAEKTVVKIEVPHQLDEMSSDSILSQTKDEEEEYMNDDEDEDDDDVVSSGGDPDMPEANNELLPSFNCLNDSNRTGFRTDGNTGKPQQFKEWHEVLQVRSYNDELLTILPYVVID